MSLANPRWCPSWWRPYFAQSTPPCQILIVLRTSVVIAGGVKVERWSKKVPPQQPYSTLLRSAHVDLKVQQELLRHSTIQSTINIYTRAVPKEKRAANRLVVGSPLRAQNWKSVSVTVAN
jgi:hypothetical protein